MDTGQRIAELLQSCAWVKDPAVALRLLPSFAEDLPAFLALPGQRPDGLGSLPLVCVPVVAGPLARVLATAGLAAARQDPAARVDQLDDENLMADPLVSACAALLREAAVPGLRAHAAPALALAWAAPRMLRGEGGQLPGVDPDDARGVAALRAHLEGLDPVARGEALHRVGWELSGRLGAAIAAVSRAGLPLPAAGLLRRLTANRLLLAFPRGSLDRSPALEQVAALLGAGIDARLAGAAIQAAAAAMAASADRVARGKPEGVDLALAANLPASDDPMRALLHPVAGPLLLGSLGSLVGVRELKKAGMDGGTAKALLKPAAHRALAAAWGDLAGPLREWDLLSAIVDRVLPLHKKDGRWGTAAGTVRGAQRWELLVPGGRGERSSVVVAVRLTALRTAVADAARTVRGLDAAGAIRRAWTDLVVEAGVPVHCLMADHGLAAFSTAEAAVRFALRASVALAGPREVLAGPTDVRLMVPDGVRPAVGVASGPVRGGTDGERSDLGGAAVAAALSLAGGGALSGHADDRSGLRRAALGPAGLQSEGLVVDAETAAHMLAHLRQSGAPLHLDGEATPVGGLGEDFRATPVRGWWDAGKPGIVVFVRLADQADAAVELLPLQRDELASFHAVDREQARLASAAPVAVGGGADEPVDVDPFASEETAFFTRPVAPPVALGAARNPSAARGLAAEPQYEGFEPSTSFMGSDGGGFGSAATGAVADPEVSGEFAAQAILSGGVEFEDEDEDSAGPRLHAPVGGGDPFGDDTPTVADDPAVAPLEGPTDWAAPSPVGRLAMIDEPAAPPRGPSAPMLLDDADPSGSADVGGRGGGDGEGGAYDDEVPAPSVGSPSAVAGRVSAPMVLDDGVPEAPTPMLGSPTPMPAVPSPLPAAVRPMPVVSAPMVFEDDDDSHDAAVLVEDDTSDHHAADPFAGPGAGAARGPRTEEVAPAGFGFVPDAVATAGPEVEIEDDWDDEDDEDPDGIDEGWESAVRGSAADRGAEVEMLRAGAAADLELVGVAGFSLQAGSSAQGSAKDPYFDPEEFTGFYDERGREAPPRLIDEAPGDPDARVETANLTELEPSTSLFGFKADNSAADGSDVGGTSDGLVSSQGQAMFEASAQVAFGLAAAPEPSAVNDAMLAELMRTFRGYVVIEDDGEYTFGLRDGGLVRDARSFDTDGDEAAAYRAFLEAKIAEGFIPRPDRVVALVPGVTTTALDEWRMHRAYQEVGG